MSTNKAIAKSTIIISLATTASRILGFVRDILMANFFGTGIAAEAFVVALRIPNLLRDLVGEGAANAAFVPVFSEYRFKKNTQELWRLTNIVLVIVLCLLGLCVISGIILTPALVRLIAPGFAGDAEKLLLTIKLTRITFPYILLVGLAAYQMGVLHTFKSFTTPALGPCLLNIGMIISIIFATRFMSQPIIGVAVGVVLGGLMQMSIQLPSIYRLGYRLSLRDLRLDLSHPAVRRIGKLLSPRLLGAGVYQLNVFVDTVLASLSNIVGIGGVAAIYYANRMIQLPMAIFGIALSSAVLPTMSQQVAQDDIRALKKTLSFSLRAIYLVILPASLGLLVLAQPIIRVLFQRGEFDAYSSNITSWALIFYSLGLFAFAATKILVSCFYSLQDTVTPVRSSFIALIINIVLNLILMFPLKIGGLALASSISATFNFCNLYHILRKKIGPFFHKDTLDSLLKMGLSALFMAGFTNFIWQYTKIYMRMPLALFLTISIAILIYVLICILLGVKEIHELIRWILKRK